jgi:hypothetical protein
MARTWLLVGLALASIVVAPAPAAAQTTGDDCATAQRLVQQLEQRLPADQSTMVPTGWTLPTHPWIAGLRPYPYPYVPTGWRPLGRGTDLTQALQQLGAYACAQSADPALARQYADLVSLLGYLQGDVADAIEQPAREILTSAESPRVRELAAAILAAAATLRRGGAP